MENRRQKKSLMEILIIFRYLFNLKILVVLKYIINKTTKKSKIIFADFCQKNWKARIYGKSGIKKTVKLFNKANLCTY